MIDDKKFLSILTILDPVIGLALGVAMPSLGVVKAATTAIVLKQPPATQDSQ